MDPVEDPHDRLLALLPVAKNAEILEQIATSMDVDMTGIAGNRKALLGKILVHLHSQDYENMAEKDRLVQEAIAVLMEHLGFRNDQNMPALEGGEPQRGPVVPDLRGIGGEGGRQDGTPKEKGRGEIRIPNRAETPDLSRGTVLRRKATQTVTTLMLTTSRTLSRT